MPVIAATYPNTDLGKIMKENGLRLWCESVYIFSINMNINKMISHHVSILEMGHKGSDYLKSN